jgi:hypothetical protein
VDEWWVGLCATGGNAAGGREGGGKGKQVVATSKLEVGPPVPKMTSDETDDSQAVARERPNLGPRGWEGVVGARGSGEGAGR